MPDAFYRLVRFLGYPAFALSASPTILHLHRLKHTGPMIIAPNHLSPYDVPCLMATTERLLDFVSITEIFKNRLAGGFLSRMNAFPLERSRVDSATTRTILDRLRRGRTIVMFPEGQIRNASNSLLAGGSFKPSVTRLARIAGVPIIPCIVLGTGVYSRSTAWIPLKRTRYAISFGAPISVETSVDEEAVCSAAVARLRQAYDSLYSELRAASGLTVGDFPWRT